MPPWLAIVVADRMDWLSPRLGSIPVAARESGRKSEGEACWSAWGENGENAEEVLAPGLNTPDGD